MILRIFKVRTYPEKRDEFRRFFLQEALPMMRAQPGLVSVTAGLPRPEAPNEFCMAMVWRDLAALKAFVGEDWERPHIHPDEEGIVESRHLSHYDVAP